MLVNTQILMTPTALTNYVSVKLRVLHPYAFHISLSN